MAVSKTRAKLVDVARQLFAKNGVDDTTMNDIAVASKKGRRTLYTYFKSKEDIYMAVVESELEMLSGAMEKVAEQDIAPDTKILRLIETHLDSIKMVVFRNGTLRAGFFRDIWRVEAVRKNFDRTETKLFRQVLTEGKEKGIFDIDNVNIVADIVHYCVKGIEINSMYLGDYKAGDEIELKIKRDTNKDKRHTIYAAQLDRSKEILWQRQIGMLFTPFLISTTSSSGTRTSKISS